MRCKSKSLSRGTDTGQPSGWIRRDRTSEGEGGSEAKAGRAKGESDFVPRLLTHKERDARQHKSEYGRGSSRQLKKRRVGFTFREGWNDSPPPPFPPEPPTVSDCG